MNSTKARRIASVIIRSQDQDVKEDRAHVGCKDQTEQNGENRVAAHSGCVAFMESQGKGLRLAHWDVVVAHR
jgi:hypothetical protein